MEVVEFTHVTSFDPSVAFRDISVGWLEENGMKVEAEDLFQLSHPNETLLPTGARIFFAVIDDEPVGTAALLPIPSVDPGVAFNDFLCKQAVYDDTPSPDGTVTPHKGGRAFELAKMGVIPKARGKGAGRALIKHILVLFNELQQEGYLAAKAMGSVELPVDVLFLESNLSLTPALTLYQSVGFEYQLPFRGSLFGFERANCTMVYCNKAKEVAL